MTNHEKRLPQIGLKDKWIRSYWGQFKRLILPGWKIGVGLAVAMIATEEEGYQYMKHGTTSWNGLH
ncbi:unnamed protein product [Heligmosomoides polygyrus]|uniref:Uncharacterized protein n=1 Tax=Heligmosomoides polygyrus TaxID=6339 RepID=A0A3P8H828_HELPZ|nr:unnamed protein product [Heligmosomoides polygyrus]